MSMPTLAAGAALYKSTGSYRGYSGRTRLDTASNVMAAATACEIGCGIADAACLVGCAFLGPFGGPCAIGCTAATALCIVECNSGGGGGGGGGGPPPPDCTTTGCRPGAVCCECVGPPMCTTPARCKFLCTL